MFSRDIRDKPVIEYFSTFLKRALWPCETSNFRKLMQNVDLKRKAINTRISRNRRKMVKSFSSLESKKLSGWFLRGSS